MSSSRTRGTSDKNTAQNTVNYAAPAVPHNLGLPNESLGPDWTQPGVYTDAINGLPSLPYDSMAFGYNGLPVDGQLPDYASPQTAAGQLIKRDANNQLSRQDELPWEIEEQDRQDEEKEDEEDEASLERRAQEAKKEALAKKRQIPPFVQKISSFLEQSRNTDLIRWSDDGRSFIVLDEDEFAKTLIPELFKHNNYASFVRQLNMYGFHKKVGLGDNSMKASETKRKTPSEYANPYFRRGKPDLLWLIQKPKATAASKAGDAKAEEDDEENASKKRATSSNQLQRKRNGSTTSSKDLVAVSQSDLDNMRQEIIGLKQQNRVISEVITNMKKQNSAIHQQAIQFQQAQERFQMQHERHENSINAILTFLATFYNRSLEGQGGQSIANMIAQTLGQGSNQSGNIVDMTDLPDLNVGIRNLPNRSGTPRQRRAPLLLPAPPESEAVSRFQNLDTPPSQPVGNGQGGSISAGDVPDIMSLINAANTNSPQNAGASNLDFNSALDHIQNADGNVPLTDAQRSRVLQRMTDDANTSLTADAKPIPSTALTPTTNSPVNLPSPNLENILSHQDSLDYVQKLQEEQAKRVQNLADKLGPLSPNGAVPGLHDDNSPLPENWNLDDWLNNNEYFQSDPAGFDLNNDDLFGASAAPAVDGNTPAQQQPPSSPPAASPAAVEEVQDADLATNGTSNPRKRRRRD